MSIAYHADVMAEVSAQAKRDLKDRYWLGLTTPKWLELMPLGITKGSGLQALVDMLGISMRDVMAFGDGENDRHMLQMFQYSFAPQNASSSAKNAAHYLLTLTNEEGAVFEGLEQLQQLGLLAI